MKFPNIKKIFDENDNIKFIDTKTLEYFAEYINKNEILSFDNLNNISNKINVSQYLTNVKILFYIISSLSYKVKDSHNENSNAFFNSLNIPELDYNVLKEDFKEKKKKIYIKRIIIPPRYTPAAVIIFLIDDINFKKKQDYNIKIFISISGTTSISDIKNDLKFSKKNFYLFDEDNFEKIKEKMKNIFPEKKSDKYEYPLIHKGFRNYQHKIYKFILSYVIEFLNFLTTIKGKKSNKTDIYLAGHSLGSTTALITAMNLSFIDVNINLLTFAQPRVGNNITNKYLYTILHKNKRFKYQRFYSKYDPIVRTPNRYRKNGYQNLGEFIKLNKLNNLSNYTEHDTDEGYEDLILKAKKKMGYFDFSKLMHSTQFYDRYNRIHMFV